MKIEINGNPGTGNTFQETYINHVETYAPNATTVINNHYGDRKPVQPTEAEPIKEAERVWRQSEIIQYVSNLKPYVAPAWKNRYESLWRSILAIPRVASVIYDPGRRKDTTFNRDLVGNIVCMLCNKGIISEINATTLTVALENNKDHSVRAQLHKEPADRELAEIILQTINKEK